MKLKLGIRCSRVHCSRGDDYINLTVEDKLSGVQFLDVEIPLGEMMRALTGNDIHLPGEVRGLDIVGKKFVSERRSLPGCPQFGYSNDKAEYKAWLKDHGAEEGWMVNDYLGSQGSMVLDQKTKLYTLNYSVFKYVEVEHADA